MSISTFLDTQGEIAIELERLLTAIPALSPLAGGEGEAEKCRALETWLRSHGITRLSRYDASDERAPSKIRPNLVAEIPGKSAESLWFMSHLDVVPAGNLSLWKTDPWCLNVARNNVGETVLSGRGVEDNQAGLVASVLAALSFVENGIVPERTIKLLFVADEENHSAYGAEWLLKEHPELFAPADMFVIPDSGDPEGETIEIAEKAIAQIEFTVEGKQAHASMPDAGANAALAAAALTVNLVTRLRAAFPETDELFEPPRSTFEPTKHDGNVENVNTIPGLEKLWFDMRILPRHHVLDVLRVIDEVCAETAAAHRVTITRSPVETEPLCATSADAPVVRQLERAIKECLGVTARPVGIGGGTVAAFFRAAGFDAAVWSVMLDTAHQPNEHVLLCNIIATAKVFARMAQ